MTGRYCFHRCLSVNISGGVPHPGLDRGYHISGWGGYPIQVWMVGGGTHPRSGVEGGTPARFSQWGVPGVPPPARSGWGGTPSWGYPSTPSSQNWMVGVSQPRGYASQFLTMGGTPGTPHCQELTGLGLDGGCTQGTPTSRPGWGIPLRWGTPPPSRHD